MTKAEFLHFALRSAKRAAQFIQPYDEHEARFGRLVCPRTSNKDEATLREPEIRTAFVLEAEEKGYWYGIEWRTERPYKFTGQETTKPKRALTDFALLKKGEVAADVLVEFKTLQNDTMMKDFVKLIGEDVGTGRCMFHVLHAVDSDSLKAIVNKYDEACRVALENKQARGRLISSDSKASPWFVLFIMILNYRGQKMEEIPCHLYCYGWDEVDRKWIETPDEPLN